jgi:type II secretory pathway component PulM
MLERVVRWWVSLQSRERRVLGIGVTLVSLVLAYLLVFDPAYVGRANHNPDDARGDLLFRKRNLHERATQRAKGYFKLPAQAVQ